MHMEILVLKSKCRLFIQINSFFQLHSHANLNYANKYSFFQICCSEFFAMRNKTIKLNGFCEWCEWYSLDAYPNKWDLNSCYKITTKVDWIFCDFCFPLHILFAWLLILVINSINLKKFSTNKVCKKNTVFSCWISTDLFDGMTVIFRIAQILIWYEMALKGISQTYRRKTADGVLIGMW